MSSPLSGFYEVSAELTDITGGRAMNREKIGLGSLFDIQFRPYTPGHVGEVSLRGVYSPDHDELEIDLAMPPENDLAFDHRGIEYAFGRARFLWTLKQGTEFHDWFAYCPLLQTSNSFSSDPEGRRHLGAAISYAVGQAVKDTLGLSDSNNFSCFFHSDDNAPVAPWTEHRAAILPWLQNGIKLSA
jgi:hypothetical protein